MVVWCYVHMMSFILLKMIAFPLCWKKSKKGTSDLSQGEPWEYGGWISWLTWLAANWAASPESRWASQTYRHEGSRNDEEQTWSLHKNFSCRFKGKGHCYHTVSDGLGPSNWLLGILRFWKCPVSGFSWITWPQAGVVFTLPGPRRPVQEFRPQH